MKWINKKNRMPENSKESKPSIEAHLGISVVKPRTFTLTWKNAETEPPKEVGRYWCIVREVNDLGVSYYQWNCAYNPNDTTKWTEDHLNLRVDVIWWTELAPRPF